MHTHHVMSSIVLYPTTSQRLLGKDKHVRFVIKRMLLCYALLWLVHAIRIGMAMHTGIPLNHFGWLIGFDLLWMSTCFVLARWGISKTWRNPVILNLQICLALTSLLVSFVLIDVGRSADLLLMVAILILGFYQSSKQHIMLMGITAWGLMAACHWVFNLTDNHGLDSKREALTLILAVLSLPWLGMIAQRIKASDDTYQEHKRVLNGTLTRLSELNTHDALTGLTHHKHMHALLDAECKRHTRNDLTFSVALFSIERLQEVNSCHGIAQGDAMIRQWGQLATQHLRSTDIVARWALHEFLVLMPETNLQGAHRSVQRLNEFLSTRWGFYHQGRWVSMDCSVGITHFRVTDNTSSLIQRLEQALLDARRKVPAPMNIPAP